MVAKTYKALFHTPHIHVRVYLCSFHKVQFLFVRKKKRLNVATSCTSCYITVIHNTVQWLNVLCGAMYI